MKIYIKRIGALCKMFKLFFGLVYRLYYWEGVEKLNFKEWLYQRRIPAKTAWEVAKHIHN